MGEKDRKGMGERVSQRTESVTRFRGSLRLSEGRTRHSSVIFAVPGLKSLLEITLKGITLRIPKGVTDPNTKVNCRHEFIKSIPRNGSPKGSQV